MLIGVKKFLDHFSFFLFKKQNQNQKKKHYPEVDIAVEQKAWPSFIMLFYLIQMKIILQ